MTIPLNPPFQFYTDQTIDVYKINANWDRIKRDLDDRIAQRFVYASVAIPFHKTVSSAFTQATPQTVRRYSLKATKRVSIDKGFFEFYGIASAAVTVTVLVNGVAPSGITNPYMSVTPDGATDTSVSDFNPAPFVLEVGDVLTVEITSTGTFSSKNTWLTLVAKSDRHNTAGTNLVTPWTFTPYRMVTTNAEDFNDKLAEIQTKLTQVLADQTNEKWSLYTWFDINGASSVSRRTRKIPTNIASAGPRDATAARLYVAEPTAAGCVVRFTLTTGAGVQIFQQSVTVTAGQTEAAVDVSIVACNFAVVSNPFTLLVEHMSGATAQKATAQLMMK